MNPKTGPKSELPLSAGPQSDRWIARARNAILLIVVVATLFFSGSVQASNPPPLPMPSPWPSGSLKPIVHPSCTIRNPCATPSLIPIPDTSTDR